MINVTKPFLPSLEEFQEYLDDIWESRYLTNNRIHHRILEQGLCEYQGVFYFFHGFQSKMQPRIKLFSKYREARA